MLLWSRFRLSLALVITLLASATCLPAAAQAPSRRCLELAAVSAATAKIHAARGTRGGTTLCHVATDANDCTHTAVVPSGAAKKHLAEHASDFAGTCEGSDMVMVAVSGTLEEGFPLRPNLDYVSPLERVDAVFLGRALIRGLRAHLDMKDPNSREYKAPPDANPVNPALVFRRATITTRTSRRSTWSIAARPCALCSTSRAT